MYSTNAQAARAFVRDALGFASVDAGQGWLIFALPPAELAIHPASASGAHEMVLTCDDVEAFIAQMSERGVSCSDVQTERWGVITHLTLPGGGVPGSLRAHPPLPAEPRLAADPRRPLTRRQPAGDGVAVNHARHELASRDGKTVSAATPPLPAVDRCQLA